MPHRIRTIKVHHVFIVVMLGFACLWIWATVMLRITKREDAAFYARSFDSPSEVSQKTKSDPEIEGKDVENDKISPLRISEFSSLPPPQEMTERMERRHRYWDMKMLAMLGLMWSAVTWMFVRIILYGIQRRRWVSPDRVAAPDAGKLIGELISLDKVLVAKTPEEGMRSEVHVDGKAATVYFKNSTFYTSFTGNKPRKLTEVPFTDILVVTQQSYREGISLEVRTTKGKVYITDKMRPFSTLAATLTDIAELNRTSPELYRASRSREPVIPTPWYAWLLFGVALAVIGGACWWMLQP